MSVIGINQVQSLIRFRTELTLSSVNSRFPRKISCLIINKITEQIPCRNYDIAELNLPENIQICDRNSNTPSKVDILLGANIFWDLLRPQQIKLGSGKTIIHNTVLGWIISGPLPCNKQNQNSICNFVTNAEIQNDLKSFWEIEECSSINEIDESYCEAYFNASTTRNQERKFIVNIPVRQLGDSYQNTFKRFTNLERRSQNDSNLQVNYTAFMKEYQELSHMSEINESNANIENVYYLPHHGVIKDTSTTTKLRVVFDGSC